MSLTITKAEIEAVDKELHEPAEDSLELAKRIIKAFIEVRESRTAFYAIGREEWGDGPLRSSYRVYGPFGGRAGAERWLKDKDPKWFVWAYASTKSEELLMEELT